MRTFFEDFTLDDGRKVTVEWGWSSREECVLVKDVWAENDAKVDFTGAESERFDAQVLALDPFPPDEPWYEDYFPSAGEA